jgi:hypothetical protein
MNREAFLQYWKLTEEILAAEERLEEELWQEQHAALIRIRIAKLAERDRKAGSDD